MGQPLSDEVPNLRAPSIEPSQHGQSRDTVARPSPRHFSSILQGKCVQATQGSRALAYSDFEAVRNCR
jgi:hypothetical protein